MERNSSLIKKIFTLLFDNNFKKSKNSKDLTFPHLPFFCPITKKLRDNEIVRDILIYDHSNQIKPRLSWYNPNDGMIPTDWFEDGLKADLKYYFEKKNCN